MKKLICLFLIFISVFSFSACAESEKANSLCLRIHIRANDNGTESQAVKYEIKEKLINYLTPILAECAGKAEAVETVNSEMPDIIRICDAALAEKGFKYKSRAEIKNEYFPLRSYGEYVFEEGNYDALIIELGEGKGDNWWCMVYPPLCFVNGGLDGSGKITYKSKILEIIENFKKEYLS